jgi:SAM-dependent methyltransferase
MTAVSAATTQARYWNGRVDPVDWKRRGTPGVDRPQLAAAAFRTPETIAAIAGLGDLRGRRLLEIACAQGYGSIDLAGLGADVTGIDLAERRCAIAGRAAGALPTARRPRFCAARAERLPFADGAFDLVFCRDVLMYADPTAVLHECHRVLVPGGRAALVESLDGHAALRRFRRLTSPPSYLAFTRHLRWSEVERLGPPLVRREVRAHHVLAALAFAGLFVLRSPRVFRLALAVLSPLDRLLLGAFPGLARFAWRATLLLERPAR